MRREQPWLAAHPPTSLLPPWPPSPLLQVTVPLASGFIPRGGIPAAEVAAPLAAPTAPVTLAPAAAQFFSSAPAQAGVVQAADGSAGRKRF